MGKYLLSFSAIGAIGTIASIFLIAVHGVIGLNIHRVFELDYYPKAMSISLMLIIFSLFVLFLMIYHKVPKFKKIKPSFNVKEQIKITTVSIFVGLASIVISVVSGAYFYAKTSIFPLYEMVGWVPIEMFVAISGSTVIIVNFLVLMIRHYPNKSI